MRESRVRCVRCVRCDQEGAVGYHGYGIRSDSIRFDRIRSVQIERSGEGSSGSSYNTYSSNIHPFHSFHPLPPLPPHTSTHPCRTTTNTAVALHLRRDTCVWRVTCDVLHDNAPDRGDRLLVLVERPGRCVVERGGVGGVAVGHGKVDRAHEVEFGPALDVVHHRVLRLNSEVTEERRTCEEEGGELNLY